VEASRDYDYISRLNYGVWFTPVRTVRMVTDIWMQVFDVPLPDVPVMQDDIRHAADYTPNCTGNMPARRRVRCREDRAVYIAVHDLYTNMTREVIKTLEHLHDLLPSEKSVTTAGISKRALAPFVGWVMRGLFGTATEDELLPIETQIRRIAQGVEMMAEGLEVQNNRLVGFMNMAVDDISNIINMTVYQEEEIRQLRELFVEQLSKLPILQALTTVLARKVEEYVTLTRDLQDFQVGVELLLHGFLTPAVVNKESLRQALQLIQRQLDVSFPGFQLLWKHPSDLYNAHDYLFGKHHSHLLIQVHLPVTTVQSPMVIYQVHMTSVIVPEKLNHTTQVIGLPRYILVDESRAYYVAWNRELDDNYDGLMYVTDGSLQLKSFDFAPECVSALFQDNAAYIMDNCDFQMEQGVLPPSITFLSKSEFLVINMSNLTIECRGESHVLPGCDMCVRELACGCTIKWMDEEGQVPIRYWPARLGKCQEMINVTEAKNVVNLAVLKSFFSDDDLKGLSAGKLLSKELQVHLPKFKHFQHRFQELLAATTKKRYDLKRLVAKVKNDSVIYHSIADVVTEEMQKVIYDSSFYDLIDPGIDSYQWWLKWMTIGLAAASFILALYLLYKVRMMAGALALLHSQAYATSDVPEVLKYDMSNKGLIKEEIRNGNATFVYEPVKFHLDMATMAITALIVILLVVIWIWYQRFTEKQVHLVLELGNGRRYVRLRVLTLKGALYAYNFKAQSYIQSLVLVRWPPKLIVNWPSFTMHNILDEVVEVFPKELWINFWNIRIVSEIVQSKAYYCLIMTEYQRQYRLLEFDNKFQEQIKENQAVFTAENHDNERQVVRTIRERIELQQPVNVLRLYPSLPELREELIDETKF